MVLSLKTSNDNFEFKEEGCGSGALESLSLASSIPGLALVVAFFAFIVDFLQEVLVVIELLFVHAAQTALLGFFLHLAAQEVLVLLVDAGDLACKALLLQLIIVLISAPDDGLLIILSFLKLLSHLLLLHLARQ